MPPAAPSTCSATLMPCWQTHCPPCSALDAALMPAAALICQVSSRHLCCLCLLFGAALPTSRRLTQSSVCICAAARIATFTGSSSSS